MSTYSNPIYQSTNRVRRHRWRRSGEVALHCTLQYIYTSAHTLQSHKDT